MWPARAGRTDRAARPFRARGCNAPPRSRRRARARSNLSGIAHSRLWQHLACSPVQPGRDLADDRHDTGRRGGDGGKIRCRLSGQCHFGRGVVRNYGGFAAPTLPEAYPFALFDGRTPAATPDWHPQVVVIALGTNDFSTRSSPVSAGPIATLSMPTMSIITRFSSDGCERPIPRPFSSFGRPISRMARLRAKLQGTETLRAGGDRRVAFVPVNGLSFTGCDAHPASPTTSGSPWRSNAPSMRSPTSGPPADALVRPILATLFAASVLVTPGEAATRWPGGAKAAVVLTYDDALPSQLDHAVPALDAAGLKGTFFLANVRAQDVARWRAVARDGHELGQSYDLPSLPCRRLSRRSALHDRGLYPGKYVEGDRTAECPTDRAGRQDGHGFATPCGETKVGGVDYLEPLRQAGLV